MLLSNIVSHRRRVNFNDVHSCQGKNGHKSRAQSLSIRSTMKSYDAVGYFVFLLLTTKVEKSGKKCLNQKQFNNRMTILEGN